MVSDTAAQKRAFSSCPWSPVTETKVDYRRCQQSPFLAISMKTKLAIVLLLASCVFGCASQNSFRPCGPGCLGNALIPQEFHGADFRPACKCHDRCYLTPGSSRQACDEHFRDHMLRACECSQAPLLCRLRAQQWYWQVKLLGQIPYAQAQAEVTR